MTTFQRFVTGSLLVLAAAVVFHALWPRYQLTHLGGPMIMKADRWTGDVRYCRGSLTESAFVCGGPAKDSLRARD